MEMESDNENILRPGRNCWRVDPARRLAFLVDGQAYFSSFYKAAQKAQKSIFISAWDIDSRLNLLRDQEEGQSARLGVFLNQLAAEKPELKVHILAWDFAMIYALEREPFPVFKLGWRSHPRINFTMDSEHPLGASHHQKLVVIDDNLAFSGGMDLTKWRWDRPEHSAHDARRRDPNGKYYPPFHDVQIMVQGPAAASLGTIFRSRWRQATGCELEMEAPSFPDTWPHEVQPDIENTRVAIARTEPAYKGRAEVREVEAAFLDSIAAARKHIYIENQYFTSHAISQAMAERLQSEDSPEMVLVMPQKGPDWLEQATMDALRLRVLNNLREADRHGKLRVYYPAQKGLKRGINLHAKVMVVDDCLVRVGSANLSNRSMGLDTECDLLIESSEPNETKTAADLRDRLLAEHLGVASKEIKEALYEKGSLIKTVEAFRGGDRTLQSLEGRAPRWAQPLAREPQLLDPEQPVDLEQLIENFAVPEDEDGSPWKRWLKWSAFAALVLSLVIAWRWGPLSEWVDVDGLAAWAAYLRNSIWAPAAVLAAYLLGGVVMFPVMVLIGATALIFDPWQAAAFAMAGSLCSAVFSYGVGYFMGRDAVRRLIGGHLNRVSRKLAKRGLATMIVVHLLPMAPFSVVNMAAGAFHIKLRQFAWAPFWAWPPAWWPLLFSLSSYARWY